MRLSIAGSILQGPVLLEMGLLAQQATATTSFMNFFTSSISVLQFGLFALLDYRLGAWFFLWCGIGGFIGQLLSNRVMRRFRHQYGLIWFLAAVILICGVALVVLDSIDFARGHFTPFGSICRAAE